MPFDINLIGVYTISQKNFDYLWIVLNYSRNECFVKMPFVVHATSQYFFNQIHLTCVSCYF